MGLAAASRCHRMLSPLVGRGELPAVRVVVRFGGGKRSSRQVTSLARHGLSIVAGPEPRGALREDLCRSMEVATSAVLDFLDILADGSLDLLVSTTVYRDIGQFFPTSSDARVPVSWSTNSCGTFCHCLWAIQLSGSNPAKQCPTTAALGA